MAFKKNDFIEIEFTARVKDGDIFGSNIKEDLEKAELKTNAKPFSFCLGQGMFLQGVDEFLIGKEKGKHVIELTAEKAFGKRKAELIQMMPAKVFKEQNLNPVQGFMFNFDGRVGKILSVSGGRIMVDFNNPVAGKDVVYEVNVLRKLEKIEDKISSFIGFLFKKELKFNIQNKKIILEVEEPMAKFVEMFKDKFKEIFEMDLEVKPVKKKKEEKPKSDENIEKDTKKSQ